MRYLFIPISVVLTLLLGCAKTEGEGGKATIKGKVWKIDYLTDNAVFPDTVPATDEDVFIVFGDKNEIGEDVKTFYDGTFEFNYLRKGTYTVFVYSNDMSNGETGEPIIREVELKSNSEEVVVEDLYIYKPDEGTSTVIGKVYVNDYDSDLNPKVPADNYYGADEDVYIMKIGEDTYFDKTSTGYDGVFRFNRLAKGDYVVYSYSKDPESDSNGPTTVHKYFTIEDEFSEVKIDDLVIIK